jgi:hypothetical protein
MCFASKDFSLPRMVYTNPSLSDTASDLEAKDYQATKHYLNWMRFDTEKHGKFFGF